MQGQDLEILRGITATSAFVGPPAERSEQGITPAKAPRKMNMQWQPEAPRTPYHVGPTQPRQGTALQSHRHTGVSNLTQRNDHQVPQSQSSLRSPSAYLAHPGSGATDTPRTAHVQQSPWRPNHRTHPSQPGSSHGSHQQQRYQSGSANQSRLPYGSPSASHSIGVPRSRLNQHSTNYQRTTQQSHNDKPKSLRILSNEEKNHIHALLRILNSDDKLTSESLQRNESLPRTRQAIQFEISEMLKRVATVPPGGHIDLEKPLFTTSEQNLVAITRTLRNTEYPTSKTDAGPGMTFAEFQKRAKDVAARHQKRKEATAAATASAVPTMSSPDEKTVSRAGPRAILSPKSRISSHGDQRGSLSPQSDRGKGKGKGKARRKMWEDDEEQGDLLDMI